MTDIKSICTFRHIILVEIVLFIVLKICYVVLGHSKAGEKLQRVACREIVDRNFVVEILWSCYLIA